MMATNKQTPNKKGKAASSNTKSFKVKKSPEEEKKASISKTKALLERLSLLVDGYEQEPRVSYDKDRQIKNINNCVNTILFNETKSVFSIPTELSIVRELIFNIQNVDGILESFNRGIERLTKRGSYDEIPEQLKKATDFSEALNKHITELNELIIQKMEEGFGSRRDLARYESDKEKAAKEELRKLKEDVGAEYAKGELFSKLEKKLEGKISDEEIARVKNRYVNDFMEANKDKIIKAVISKKDYAVVAESFEVEMKVLYAFLSRTEKEEKIEKALLLLEDKLVEDMVNDLVANKITVSELHKKYPGKLVNKAASIAKSRKQEDTKPEKEVSEKKA
jgi:hypothetical protein